MAVARQGAVTAVASSARLARPANSRPERPCFAKTWMDGAPWRGGSHVARGHVALDASRHTSAGGFGRRGARTSPTARRCESGHPRSARQYLNTSGRARGHAVRSDANTDRAACPIASPRDRAPTGEKGGAPHIISANREKNPRIRWRKLTIRHPRSAHAAGSDG